MRDVQVGKPKHPGIENVLGSETLALDPAGQRRRELLVDEEPHSAAMTTGWPTWEAA